VKQFVRYDGVTGKVLAYGNCSDLDFPGQGPNVIESPPVDGSVNYMPGGVVTARPACPIAGSVTGNVITLTGVPVGTVVTVYGAAIGSTVVAPYTVTQTDPSGTLALTVPAGGSYTVIAFPFPAQDYLGTFST
jgi:hypothetical protein